MKQRPFALVLTCLLLTACSTPHLITTVDGQQIYARDKPEYMKDENAIRYTDKNGNTVGLSRDQVVKVEEIDD